MEREKSNNQNKIPNQGYVIVPNYFLRDWVKVLGGGPALLYLELLTYCHKEKDIVWPTLITLSNKLAISKNSLISYRKTLLKYGLIKKMVRRRSAQGNYRSNLYQITPLEGAKNGPGLVQNLGEGSANFAPGVVQNLHPNNNNLKHYQYNNKKEAEKDVVIAVDFKKLKKKGDLSACNAQAERGRSQSGNAQAEEKMQALREQLTDLSLEEKFIEQILKDFSLEKIEEKLELLRAKTNIQNPAGWLISALKNDYQDPEPEKYDKEPVGQLSENQKTPPREEKASSREVALEMIRKTREMLANLQKKEEMCNGTKRINCQS